MVSFISSGKQSTRRKPPTCRKSHYVVSSTSRHEWGSDSTLVVMGTDCTGGFKSIYLTITTTPHVDKASHVISKEMLVITSGQTRFEFT